jgi:DNA-binding FrmR family transcriptional regulator
MDRKPVLADLNLRIRTIEGHLHKVEEMLVDKQVECGQILEQTNAIEGALKSLDKELILYHFKHCLCAKGDKCKKHDLVVDEIVNCLDKRKI